MSKKYYLSIIAAFTVAAMPALSNAQALIDTGAATGIGASLDARNTSATMNVRDTIRQKIQNSYGEKAQNAKNNEDYRNEMLRNQASTSQSPVKLYASSSAASAPKIRGEQPEKNKEMRLSVFKIAQRNLARQLQQALDNLKQIRGRIESRITKAEESGRDMANAKNLLVTADAKILLAQNAINAVLSYATTTATTTVVTASSTQTASSTVDLTKPRDLANYAKLAIKAAKESLNSVVVAIAHGMGLKLGAGKGEHGTTTSATSTSTTTASTTTQKGDTECPDEKIINKMPMSSESSYYIKNGKRKEISEYNNLWVEKNCEIPVQEVY